MASGDMNSGPHADLASAFLTHPLFQLTQRFYRICKRLHSKVMCSVSWGPWSQIHSLCLLLVTPPQRPSPPPPTVSAQSPAPPLRQGPPRTPSRLCTCPAGVWWKPDNFLATWVPRQHAKGACCAQLVAVLVMTCSQAFTVKRKRRVNKNKTCSFTCF